MPQLPFEPHIDPAHLGDRAARGCLGGIFDQISGCAMSIIVGIIALIMVLGAGGYAIYLMLNPDARPPSIELPVSDRTWEGKSTLHCTGHERFRVAGVTATLDDVGVVANEHCQLDLEDVTIRGKVALRVSDHAVVRVKRSKLGGKKVGVEVSEHGSLEIEGSRVSGKTAIEARDHGSVKLENVELKGEARPVGQFARIEGAAP